MPQGTGGMGTGSDTRIYNPRSESSHMYVNNHEEDRHGAEDGAKKDEMIDRKREKDSARRRIMSKVKHIKVKPSDLEELKDDEEGEDDADKRDQEREISAQTGPPGNLGFLTSLAMGARGPGAAGGQQFAMGEPMEDAWSSLLKYDTSDLTDYEINRRQFRSPHILGPDRSPEEISALEAEERRRAMDRMAEFQRLDYPDLMSLPFLFDEDIADMVQGALDHDHGDYFGDRIDPNELHQYIREYAGDEAADRYIQRYKDVRTRLGGLDFAMAQPHVEPTNMAEIQDSVNRFNKDRELHTEDLKNIMPNDETIFDAYPFPANTFMANELVPPFTLTPQSEHTFQQENKGEPMDIAFQLLKEETQGFISDKNPKPKKDKGDKAKEKKAKKEERKKFRPSTGQFKMPPGGVNPASATSRRAKARSRGIKSDKKTGLGRSHLAVEMSHRGVQTKQPTSKDPQKYRQYMGQQEGRKRLGGVRTVASTPARFGARSYTAGATGGGRLQGVARPRRPALKPHRIPPIMSPAMPPRPTMPTPPPIPSAPPLPMVGVANQQMAGPPMMRPGRLPSSSVQGVMTGPVGKGSEIQKSLTRYDIIELRQLIADAKRAIKQKDSKKKGMGTKDTGGAGSSLPKHPENGPKQTTRPEGATEDANNEPRTFGMDPIGHYTSRGGRTP